MKNCFMRKAYVFTTLVLLTACPESNSTSLNNENVNYCRLGCAHLMNLTGRDGEPGCEEARPLVYPNGFVETCEQLCLSVEENGRELNPKCWVNVKSCDQIETNCRSNL